MSTITPVVCCCCAVTKKCIYTFAQGCTSSPHKHRRSCPISEAVVTGVNQFTPSTLPRLDLLTITAATAFIHHFKHTHRSISL